MKGSKNRFVSRLSTGILLLTLLAVMSGCAKKQDEIKIGAVLCLTGSGAPYGEDALRGIQLAVEDIEGSEGMDDKPIRLIVEDDQTDPTISATATSKLINQDKVEVIIGPVTSSSMLAAAPTAERAKVVMISPGASNPNITEAGDYIFRNWISDKLEGRAMARYIYSDEGVGRVAIIYINNDYGTGLANVFKAYYESLGGEITAMEMYDQGDTDFRSQLVKVQSRRPERIYIPGYYREMALLLKQAKELGIGIEFRSVVTFEEDKLLELAGETAEGVIYSSPYYNPASLDSTVSRFVSQFRERFGRTPGIFAAHGYDAMMLIYSVLLSGNQYSATAIKDGLYSIKNYHGVSGITTFDQNGDVLKPVSIKRVLEKEFIVLKVYNADNFFEN